MNLEHNYVNENYEEFKKHENFLRPVFVGKCCVIESCLLRGIFDTIDDALTFAYKQYGVNGNFICQEIRENDEPIVITRLLVG